MLLFLCGRTIVEWHQNANEWVWYQREMYDKSSDKLAFDRENNFLF